jgi:hypothetical protein
MIKSQTERGAIYAGDTSLAFTCTIEQTAPATLSLSSGLLTLTSGLSFPVPALSIEMPNGVQHLYLGLRDGALALYAAAPMSGFDPAFTALQMVAGFGSGIQVVEGAIVGDVHVLTVLPGFPDGAQPSQAAPLPNWQELKNELRGTELFTIALTTKSEKGFALLLSTLNSNEPANSTGRLDTFYRSIQMIRMGLATDYTPEQVTRFNSLLTAAHFPLQIA